MIPTSPHPKGAQPFLCQLLLFEQLFILPICLNKNISHASLCLAHGLGWGIEWKLKNRGTKRRLIWVHWRVSWKNWRRWTRNLKRGALLWRLKMSQWKMWVPFSFNRLGDSFTRMLLVEHISWFTRESQRYLSGLLWNSLFNRAVILWIA